MKRISIILICLMFFTSCGKSTNNVVDKVNIPKRIVYTIQDYFPLTPDLRIKYAGKGMEYAQKELYVDYIHNNRIQFRQSNGGTTSALVYEILNGELRLLTIKGEFYYRDDLTSIVNDKPDILLKEPLETNNSWLASDGSKRTITHLNSDVETPYGKFKAIEVTTEHKNYKQLDYYSLGTGLIKSEFAFNNGDKVESLLEKLEDNITLKQNLKIYYPDFNNNKLVYKVYPVEFKTNDRLKDKFETLLKQIPCENISPLLKNKSKINYINLSENGDIANIDFTSDFTSNMNVASSLESMLLQSIVNTFGDYYNVKKVYISLDGQPYESVNIKISKDEYFNVNFKNCSEVK